MNIAVVIPLYNKELYIARAIESVMNQSYPASEIIIVDDGSTDNSNEVVASLAKKNSSIKLHTQKNQGVSFTRNRGVELATSNYIAFLDADDEWKPDFLSHIQRLHNNFPDCGAYATSYEVIEEDGNKSFPAAIGIPPAPWIGIIPNLFRMMQKGSPFFTSSVIITKAVFQDLNGFPIGVKRGEDKTLWIRLGVKYPIAYSPSRQVVYHTDAINRASNIYERESADTNLLDRMLKNQEVPSSLIEDIKDYNAFLKIQKVSTMVKEGHANLARNLLNSTKENQRYHHEWLWWYFWSIMPYSLIKLVQWIRIKIYLSLVKTEQP